MAAINLSQLPGGWRREQQGAGCEEWSGNGAVAAEAAVAAAAATARPSRTAIFLSL